MVDVLHVVSTYKVMAKLSQDSYFLISFFTIAFRCTYFN